MLDAANADVGAVLIKCKAQLALKKVPGVFCVCGGNWGCLFLGSHHGVLWGRFFFDYWRSWGAGTSGGCLGRRWRWR